MKILYVPRYAQFTIQNEWVIQNSEEILLIKKKFALYLSFFTNE